MLTKDVTCHLCHILLFPKPATGAVCWRGPGPALVKTLRMIIWSVLKEFLQLIPTGLTTTRDENTQLRVGLHLCTGRMLLWHCTTVTPRDLPLPGADETSTGVFRDLTDCKGREPRQNPGCVCSREGVIGIRQQLHVEQSCHFRAKTMDCVCCLHFSHPLGTEAEVTHPVVHCSISVLASREKQNKEELSLQDQGSNQGMDTGSHCCSPAQDTAANPSE